MQLAERNQMGEILYECDRCQIVGPKDSCIIEENAKHLCMSCWYEKERNRVRRNRAVIVEV
jgi:CO dehydrogenase/acetyl-CoA synthase beta subunit